MFIISPDHFQSTDVLEKLNRAYLDILKINKIKIVTKCPTRKNSSKKGIMLRTLGSDTFLGML